MGPQVTPFPPIFSGVHKVGVSHYIRKGVGICILLGRLRKHGVRSRVFAGSSS